MDIKRRDELHAEWERNESELQRLHDLATESNAESPHKQILEARQREIAHELGIAPNGGRIDPGKAGENFVEWAFQQRFGRGFLFRSPKFQTRSGEHELCDLFLLLDDTAVLVQVKTADRYKRPNRSGEDWVSWTGKRLDDALAQLKDGVEALLAGQIPSVENELRGKVLLDVSKLQHLFGVLVVDHPDLDKYGRAPALDTPRSKTCVLTTTHREIPHILTELSTPGDLIDYIRARGEFFEQSFLQGVSELDLLAFYKQMPTEFRSAVTDGAFVQLGEGLWGEFEKLEARTRRAILDEPSYLIDAIIDRLLEGIAGLGKRHRTIPFEIAAELAKVTRTNRRAAGRGLEVRSEDCKSSGRDRRFAWPPFGSNRPAIAFLVSMKKGSARAEALNDLVLATQLKAGAWHVIGVGVSPINGGIGAVDTYSVRQDPHELRRQLSPTRLAKLTRLLGEPRDPQVTEFGGYEGDEYW